MATLVDQQGDVIDSIESQARRQRSSARHACNSAAALTRVHCIAPQVAKSTEYVERGKASLVQARSHQRSARTKMILVAVGIIAIIAIIACAIAIPAAVRG
jgi:cobalamin biosynthesis Mg chelatase CobN